MAEKIREKSRHPFNGCLSLPETTSIWQLLRGYLRQSVHSSHLFHFTLYGD